MKQNSKVIIIELLEGWDIPPKRRKKFDRMMAKYPLGDPIVAAKCRNGKPYGLFIASDNGFAWGFYSTYR